MQHHTGSYTAEPARGLVGAKRRRGRPRLENPKQAVSLRLEPAVLEKFKATGPGWQRRMNDVLKAAIV